MGIGNWEWLILFPVTSPQSPVTSPQSPVTSHQSPVTSHQSPVPSHQSPITSPQSCAKNNLSIEKCYKFDSQWSCCIGILSSYRFNF
ncbi:hypothetical protein H6F47_15755 [Sphaerospermopsis sp. FACHB-1094]|uniref:hypothetical protein n=1 Tax=Sphaerospermopsis sp. FACHB-1094 TaxID=2692861 RepID=UPI001684B012|nr:hypothetical protein [Sphaerospermopsis sp. FACHB-1094]MBD2133844.1 hypothetical protein [Sphaerospermopsis sp. FACHB-1094]